MSYQIYNDTATLKIVENGQSRNLSKVLTSVNVQGNDIVIGYDSNENYLRIAYTDVTVPSEASAEALRNTLNGYLTNEVITQGASTYQQQYNQTELFEMILQELQEQTRILKKIYQ